MPDAVASMNGLSDPTETVLAYSHVDEALGKSIKTSLETRGVTISVISHLDDDAGPETRKVVAIIGGNFKESTFYQTYLLKLEKEKTPLIVVLNVDRDGAWPSEFAGFDKRVDGVLELNGISPAEPLFEERMDTLLGLVSTELNLKSSRGTHSLKSSEQVQPVKMKAQDPPSITPPEVDITPTGDFLALPDFSFNSLEDEPVNNRASMISVQSFYSDTSAVDHRLSVLSISTSLQQEESEPETPSNDPEFQNPKLASYMNSPLPSRPHLRSTTPDSPRWNHNRISMQPIIPSTEDTPEPTLETEPEDSQSKYDLAMRYLEPPSGSPRKSQVAAAITLLHSASSMGNSRAQCRLGRLYDMGVPEFLPQDRMRASEQFRLASENADPEGMARYGRCLEQGAWAPRNVRSAISLYRRSADANHPLGLYYLGRCHENGVTDEEGKVVIPARSFKEAYALYQRSANLGDHHGLEAAGYCLQLGLGVAKDEFRAVDMYRQSANLGSAAGQFSLAECYRNGVGVPMDPAAVGHSFLSATSGVAAPESSQDQLLKRGAALAIPLYEASAAQGYAPAMSALGFCYRHGIGVSRDLVKAVTLYRDAAERGDSDARYRLAFCLVHRIGVPDRDEAAALQLLRLASDQDDSNAQCFLGQLLEKGGEVIPYDPVQAVALYRQAAANGHKEAMVRFARCLELGVGIKRDLAEAIRIYQAQATASVELAQYYLGRLHEVGVDDLLKKDMKTAVRMYQKGCERQLGESLHRLGELIRDGVSPVKKDPARAFRMFERAAAVGHAGAQNDLAMMLETGSTSYRILRDLPRALRMFIKSAEQGHLAGQFNTGRCYRLAIGTTRDLGQAVRWLDKACKQGSADAQLLLGDMHRDGMGLPRDAAAAARLYKKAADAKNIMAQTHLAMLLETGGPGLRRDPDTAFKLYTKSSEGGHALAIYHLGLLYENGAAGCPEDPLHAIEFYKRAAEQGEVQAIIRLGDCHRDGVGFDRDLGQAAFRYAEAIELKSVTAQARLAMLHIAPVGDDLIAASEWVRTEKNPRKGAAMLFRASEMGETAAMNALGDLYRTGSGAPAVPLNPIQAVALYTRAAQMLGDPTAMNSLGMCCEQGIGNLQRDIAAAVKWYQTSADLGCAPALVSLGRCLQQGIGVAKDPHRAAKMYHAAAEMGDAAGLYALGLVYATATGMDGLKQDVKLALSLFRRAAGRGNAAAMNALGYYHEEGISGLSKDGKAAFDWYAKAAGLRDPAGVFNLAVCYERGVGVAQDMGKAVDLYGRAVGMGHESAGESLRRLSYGRQ
ncbi:hypothetical protein HDU67_002513 [Dinochytrium kinnereticum]|nr:hypothetical protein HDU67_002513 [Dinochytrium kinnereticum]